MSIEIKEFCCSRCGSTNIQIQAWVDANTHEYKDNIGMIMNVGVKIVVNILILL